MPDTVVGIGEDVATFGADVAKDGGRVVRWMLHGVEKGAHSDTSGVAFHHRTRSQVILEKPGKTVLQMLKTLQHVGQEVGKMLQHLGQQGGPGGHVATVATSGVTAVGPDAALGEESRGREREGRSPIERAESGLPGDNAVYGEPAVGLNVVSTGDTERKTKG